MDNLKKTSRLFAFCASLLIGVGVLVGSPIAAAPILSDNFDAYSDGGLTGQGDWANYYRSCVVVNGAVGCGDDGLHGNYKEGNMLSSGSMSVDFRVYSDERLNSPTETGFGGIWISPFPFGNAEIQLSIYYNNADGIYLNGVAGKFFLDDPDEWHTATVIWDETAADWYVDDTLIYEDIPTKATDYTTVNFGVFPAGASMWIDNIGAGAPPHELAITWPEDEASLGNQLHHFTVEYFTPDCGDFHLQIAIGTNEQDVENATSSSPGIQYVDTLFGLPEWCAAEGEIDVGNYVIFDENTNYYAKPILYRWEGWNKLYDTKLGEGAVIGFVIGEYFGMATANAAAGFYADHLPAFFGETEPSAIYSTLTKVFNAVFNPILDFLSDITIYFSTSTAIENGAAAGYPIAVFLAYAALINDFAGIPLVEIITTMLILQLAIVVINLALKGKKTAI